MAEAAVAALYTAETVAEGAAVGAVAVAKSTVPVVVCFRKNKSPSQTLALSSHSLNYYKGRAYIFGGDYAEGLSDNIMRIVTLPSDLDLGGIDYRSAKNVAPIVRYAHASTTIASDIFIFGGRASKLPGDDFQTSLIDEQGTVHVYSAIDNKWTTLIPNLSLYTSGVQASKSEGEIERPEGGLTVFAVDAWTDYGGGAAVIWGGKGVDGETRNEGWVVTVD